MGRLLFRPLRGFMDRKIFTVVQSNELIEAAYSLTVDEMRLILLASSKVDSRRSNVGQITIYPDEFSKAFNLPKKHVYDNLRKSVSQIMRKPVVFFEDGERIERAWLIENRYKSDPTDGTYITIQFSPLIEPYLFDLKEKFTVVDLEKAAKLNTPFSFRLYQWLVKAKNLRLNKDGCSIAVELEIEWMKEQSGNKGSYPQWRDYKERVIQPAVDQINSKTDISVIWKPIKQGRKVSSIQFNYVIEEASFAKPVRPRLSRRPKVTKGSHEEGVWMRKNLRILLEYERDLKLYDCKAKLEIKDVERIAEYSSICDHVTHKRAKKELLARRKTILS